MTIDELLELAQGRITASMRTWDKGGSPEVVAMYAAIAQAAAQTAQAMDYHRFIDKMLENAPTASGDGR